MGSEYKGDREKRTLEISHTQFIRKVVECFGITKISLISAFPSLDLRHVSDEEPVVDASYREMVGSLRGLRIKRGRIPQTQCGRLQGFRMTLRRYMLRRLGIYSST